MGSRLAVLFGSFSMVVLTAFQCSASAGYQLPAASTDGRPSNDADLQKISETLSSVAERSRKALVLVSITKPVQGVPPEFMDPFRFFFGPNSPFNFEQPGPRDGRPNQPRQRQRSLPKEQGIGSGTIVDIEKGYILTNNHVVEGADDIHVKTASGQVFAAKVVGRDPNTDIAVVQIKDKDFANGVTALTLGDSDAMKIGNLVLALGAPFGLETSVTFGVVSATGRGPLEIAKMGNFIQTDAAINPGNSGGPLLNMQGQVIGVNTAIYSGSGSYAGVGFAVPSNLARTIAQELINHGKIDRGYIGAQLSPLNPDIAKDLGLPLAKGGALISNVVKGGPAEKAGIQPSDVVTAIEGKEMNDSSAVVNAVGLMKPGTKAKFTVFRNGKSIDVQITIGAYPGKSAATSESRQNEAQPFGMSLAPVSSELGLQFNFESKRGAVVIDLDETGRAARSGIEVGDVILDCNGKKIETPGDFFKLAKGLSKVLVRIERAGNYFFVTIK